MPHRDLSPAVSENEFDITNALFHNDDENESSDSFSFARQPQSKAKGKGKDKKLLTESLDLLGNGSNDDSEEDDNTFIAAQQSAANRKSSSAGVKKGGGFQAMGLNARLLKAISRKGFSIPTPIQRKTIPVILDDRDVVGMARTGSGKTAAFVIPMIEKLKGHSSQFGARGLIMSPSRELALQTLKVVKELSKGTDLKAVLLVGGDSLEEQFGMMAGNPDIVIATPGRFLHLKVEMNLDLRSVQYAVFDEADRLFEMGFAAQLTEILHGLPASRQTLLFSATLPKSLVEFARAGLQEPALIRLDTESKVSPDLQSAFFTVKSADKEGALLYILHEVIKMPTGPTGASQEQSQNSMPGKKRKRSEGPNTESPTRHSTIIFTATKHHVDYLQWLLREAGFAVSYDYGSLDQTARRIQVQNFRTGVSNILVVTDVAARGIDIPVLANVINYDFPSQPKIFVHRVGRTARAGQKGWSYSLVRDADAPYLLDLQLFLGRKLVLGRQSQGGGVNFAEDIVVGSFRRDALSQSCEWITKVLDEDGDIAAQSKVAGKGEKLYMRTRNAASQESAKRAKAVVSREGWTAVHPLFDDDGDDDDDDDGGRGQMEAARESMLARIGGYRPQETIFETRSRRGAKNEKADETIETIQRIRARRDNKKKQHEGEQPREETEQMETKPAEVHNGEEDGDDATSDDLEVTFSAYGQAKPKKGENATAPSSSSSAWSFQNPEYFMSYTPASGQSVAEDRGYGVHSGANANFAQASRSAAMDLAGDEGASGEGRAAAKRWDKRHKKYVSRSNDEDGSKGGRLVRGESGAKISAGFRSGRFEAWKKGKRMGRLPRVGEAEMPGLAADLNEKLRRKRFRHAREQAPKAADPLRSDYAKKRKQNEAAGERSGPGNSKGRSEIRSTEDIRLGRKMQQRRKEKNARPSRRR